MLLWRMIGNNPIMEAVLLPLIIALVADHAVIRTKLDNFEKQFSALAKDFKEHLANHRNIENSLFKLNEQILSFNKDFLKLSENIRHLNKR